MIGMLTVFQSLPLTQGRRSTMAVMVMEMMTVVKMIIEMAMMILKMLVMVMIIVLAMHDDE